MYWPYLVVFVLLAAMFLFSVRNRRRQAAAQQANLARIGFGSEVMTTSGLYGTVISRNDEDETAQLVIAPGVEVKWALAALRDVASLPGRYQRGIPGGGAPGAASDSVDLRKVTGDAHSDAAGDPDRPDGPASNS